MLLLEQFRNGQTVSLYRMFVLNGTDPEAVLAPTQVKVDRAVRARYGPVSKRDRNGPIFRSFNILTFHGLKTHNGPIIFIIFTGQ